MTAILSDALVLFGATGDLAYKQILPALQAMIRRGQLDAPVVGVAKAGWNLDQFKARAKDSLEKHGGLDVAAFTKLTSLLRYVDADYQDPTTFARLRRVPDGATRPLHYLAIPPACLPPSSRGWPRPAVLRMVGWSWKNLSAATWPRRVN
jgi:glucose-6-phosphate 1-dehydrogenase